MLLLSVSRANFTLLQICYLPEPATRVVAMRANPTYTQLDGLSCLVGLPVARRKLLMNRSRRSGKAPEPFSSSRLHGVFQLTCPCQSIWRLLVLGTYTSMSCDQVASQEWP